jgi:hypothetical protein
VKSVRETCERVSIIFWVVLSVNEILCFLLQSNLFASLLTAVATFFSVWITLRAGFKGQMREWDRRDNEAKSEQYARQKAAGRALAVELLYNFSKLFSVWGLAKEGKPTSLPALTRLQFDTQLPLIALLLDYKEFGSVVTAYSRLDYYTQLQNVFEKREINRGLNSKELEQVEEAMNFFDTAYKTVTKKVFTPDEIADFHTNAPP